MKKKSVAFWEPISSSWAFIYPFVMLTTTNCLSHHGFDTYSSIHFGPGAPPFSHANSSLLGFGSCTVVRVPQQGV